MWSNERRNRHVRNGMGVNMLNCLGLSDIILQCDPEPSLVKWAESVKSKRQERTVIRSSPRRSPQSNEAVENDQKQMQGQVRTMMEALQDRKQYRPTTDSAHPTPKLGDRWKSTVWLGKSDLTDEHLVRTDEGVVYARSARRIAEHRWSEEELRAVVEAPQKPKSTTSLLQLTHFLLHLQYQKCVKTRRRNPQRNQRKTRGCRSSHQTQR